MLVVNTYRDSKAQGLLFGASLLIVLAYVASNYFNVLTGRRYDAVMALRELSGIPAVLIGGWLCRCDKLQRMSAILLIGGILLTIAEAVWLRSLRGKPADVQLFVGTLPLAAGLLGMAIATRNLTPEWLAELGRRESLGITFIIHWRSWPSQACWRGI
ncbi:hypothetical protein [Paracoccus indicus]|uniref:hypothetical protein n=1 Tax=Paracoccus indicus TaxID=2079229 RepID=UPI000D3BFB89|nr:hypothetical protein [Paracoccus indicus]